MQQKTTFFDWGSIEYKHGWEEQELLFKQVLTIKNRNRSENQNDITPNFLVFCEHPHVYTLGKSGSEQNLLIDYIQLAAKDATFFQIDRGGDITYHGPGQIVGYPILDLDNFGLGLKSYIHLMEECIIALLAKYNITAERLDGATGVWIETQTPRARKICAIGVKSSRYVTMHGFALNVNTNLSYFSHINPCGFQDKGVTSIEKELGAKQDFEQVKEDLKAIFYSKFQMVD